MFCSFTMTRPVHLRIPLQDFTTIPIKFPLFKCSCFSQLRLLWMDPQVLSFQVLATSPHTASLSHFSSDRSSNRLMPYKYATFTTQPFYVYLIQCPEFLAVFSKKEGYGKVCLLCLPRTVNQFMKDLTYNYKTSLQMHISP